ncbi:MAG: hypothetical protein HY316_10265 [Acidobacteria bacterium]|nr:hypothetical protein [Acidobacteriota bacterium]
MASEPLVRPRDESFLSGEQSLKGMFDEVIQRNFEQTVHLADHEVLEYVADLLIRFSRTEELYQIRDTRGKQLEDVGEMLIASNPLLDAPSFDTEREVRKHIGDFTLFFAGLFPEAVNQWRLRRARLDALLDYIRTGKESYYIVSEFNQFEYRATAPLFKKMSEEFERCVFGLNMVKRDFERMQQESYVRARNLLI